MRRPDLAPKPPLSNLHGPSLSLCFAYCCIGWRCTGQRIGPAIVAARTASHVSKLGVLSLWSVTRRYHTSQTLNHQLFSGTTADVVEIKSIKVFPDPPQPGQNLTVNVVAYVHEVVEVCCPSFTFSSLIDLSLIAGRCICGYHREAWFDQTAAETVRHL